MFNPSVPPATTTYNQSDWYDQKRKRLLKEKSSLVRLTLDDEVLKAWLLRMHSGEYPIASRYMNSFRTLYSDDTNCVWNPVGVLIDYYIDTDPEFGFVWYGPFSEYASVSTHSVSLVYGIAFKDKRPSWLSSSSHFTSITKPWSAFHHLPEEFFYYLGITKPIANHLRDLAEAHASVADIHNWLLFKDDTD